MILPNNTVIDRKKHPKFQNSKIPKESILDELRKLEKKRDEEEEEDDMNVMKDKKKSAKNIKTSKSGPKSIVDDQFFKLHELEMFLNNEDLKESRKTSTNKEQMSDEEEDTDDEHSGVAVIDVLPRGVRAQVEGESNVRRAAHRSRASCVSSYR